MDSTVLLALTILVVAAALGAIFWRAAHGAWMRKAREDRGSARRHRQITKQYRREQSGLGE